MNIKKLARELAEKAAPAPIKQPSNLPHKLQDAIDQRRGKIGNAEKAAPREFTETKTLPTPNKKEPKGQSHGRQSTAERERGLNEQTSIGQHYTEPYSMSAGRTTVPNEMDHPTDTSRGIPTAAHSKYGEGRSEMRPYQGMIKPNAPLQDPRTRKSDFDDLVRAINVNIMNSYSKFRNKDGLDEFIQGEKKRTGGKKDQTKLEKPDKPSKPDLPNRVGGLGDSQLEYQLRKPRKVGSKESRRYGVDRRISGGKNQVQFDESGKVIPPKESPKVEPLKNPYRVDEKGKYIRGTGYEKPVTGYKKIKPRKGTDRSREALPSTRTRDRHEGKLQANPKGRKGLFSNPNTDAGKKVGVHGEDQILGIETQEPLAPHAHLREQDKKTGEVISNRYSTDPRNVKWRKGGHKPNTAQERAEENKKIRQGMINLKANLDAVMKKIQQTTFGTTFDDAGEHAGDKVPTRETFGDKRWRVPQINNPKDEKEQAESKRRADLSRNQWEKDFAMHYQSPDKKEIDRYMKFRKALKALMIAKLSPISFKYTYKGWGNTYERGQTKNVESQDHSRTGNTNNKQLYEGDKDDNTIKSLDEVYKEFKKKQ